MIFVWIHTHVRTCSSLFPAIVCVHWLYDPITHQWWNLLLSKTHSWETGEFPLALWAPLPLPRIFRQSVRVSNSSDAENFPVQICPCHFFSGWFKLLRVKVKWGDPSFKKTSSWASTRAIFLSRLICPSPQCPSTWVKLTLYQKSN